MRLRRSTFPTNGRSFSDVFFSAIFSLFTLTERGRNTIEKMQVNVGEIDEERNLLKFDDKPGNEFGRVDIARSVIKSDGRKRKRRDAWI